MARALDISEMRSLLFWRDVLAEVIATFYMMVFVTFSMVSLDKDLYKPSTPLVGLMVGLVIFILIEAFRPISGGHLNPCVSFAAAVMKRISPVRALFYTCAQCVGSVLACFLVKRLTPEDSRSQIFAFTPNENLSSAQAVFTEAFLIFNLIFVGLSVSEKKHKEKGAMPGLPTGLCVGLAIMAAGTYTGVCVNPAVALGPAAAVNNFFKHWVYWLGDYLGTLAGIVVFMSCQKLQARHDRMSVKILDEDVEKPTTSGSSGVVAAMPTISSTAAENPAGLSTAAQNSHPELQDGYEEDRF